MRWIETDKQFYKKALLIAVPITLQSMITIGVNMIDTVMVGSLGEIPLSSVSLANQFVMFFQICCMGIGMGASVLTARFWGMRDLNSLKKVIAVTLRFTALFALVFTVLSLFATRQVIGMYSKEAAVIANGVIYLKWSWLTFLLGGMSVVSTNVMRSINLVRIPLFASIGTFFIKTFCNYIFIFGNLGAPQMGVAGAALGTVLARGFECFFICGYFLFIDKRVSFRPKDLLMKCADMVPEYIRVSIPVLISDGLLGLGLSVTAMVAGRIGSGFVSANAITSVTQQMSTVFIQGLAFASCIMTGQTLGEGRVNDARKQGVTFFVFGTAIGAVAGLIIFLIRTPVINAYALSAQTKLIAERLMDAVSLIVIFQASNSVLTKGVLRGGGDTRFLMVADILFLWLVSIPAGFLAGLVFHLPPFWILICLRSDQFIKAVWCVFRLRSGKWIKKVKGAKEFPKIEDEPNAIAL